ncbi:MAG: hypothetical protein R3320_08745 [Nitriliruptorales bacterium]|nr:hypothetical protein [Nitriliruptorales bacterium]
MNDAIGRFFCTIEPETVALRAPRAQRLRELLVDTDREDRALLLRFSATDHTKTMVEGFAEDERECCSFFDFEITSEAEHVVLTLSAPPGAEHMLDAAQRSFTAPAIGD